MPSIYTNPIYDVHLSAGDADPNGHWHLDWDAGPAAFITDANSAADHVDGAAFSLGDDFFVGGNSAAENNTFEAFDGSSWSAKTATPDVIAYQMSFVSRDKGFFAGGTSFDQGTEIASVRMYDKPLNSWSLATSMPRSRYESIALSMPKGDVAFLIAGKNLFTSCCYRFDTSLLTFRSIPELQTSRRHGMCGWMDPRTGIPHVVGGKDDAGAPDNYFSTHSIYTDLTNTWSTLADVTAARAEASGTHANERGWVLGGRDEGGTATNTIYVWSGLAWSTYSLTTPTVRTGAQNLAAAIT